MIPKIIFRYSWIYDERFRDEYKCQKDYPSSKRIINYMKRVEKLWKKNEKKVLAELSKISGLRWKSKQIYCYVVGRCVPFSDPLTMPIYDKYPDYFIDTLIHELIHQLFTQDENLEKLCIAWNYFNKKYKKEHFTTRIHIPLHALHAHVYLKFFGEKRLKRDIRLISSLPYYKKSWEIVQKEGYKKIIAEFRKRVKK